MSKTDHLAKAKRYIARGEDFYEKAVVEIRAARAEGKTWDEINAFLGRGEKYAERLVAAVDKGLRNPFGGENNRERVDRSAAKRVLRDPEQRKQAIASLSPEERVEVARVTEEVRAEAEETFDADRPKPRKKADWGEISTRLYSARRGAEQSLNELRTLGRDQLDDTIADDLLDQAERTVGAYELLAAFLRGRDTIEDIERFLAEQEA